MNHAHPFRWTRRWVVVVLALACARTPSSSAAPSPAPPAFMLGDFQDDYGGRHAVSATEWIQRPNARYHIVRWVPERRYLIAHNDSANRSAPGKWTRIDWIALTGMPPYEWGFCFTAYEAPTAAAAESTSVAKPETPRTGCNGFPYSRMKR